MGHISCLSLTRAFVTTSSFLVCGSSRVVVRTGITTRDRHFTCDAGSQTKQKIDKRQKVLYYLSVQDLKKK